jgi:hypothetical protein
MLVTFIFKLPNDNKKYFGKGIICLSGDNVKELDREIRDIIFSKIPSVNKNKVKIGILSCERHNWDYFSKDERSVFDLLYIEYEDHHELYINFLNNENNESIDTSTYDSSSNSNENSSTEDENSSTEDENNSSTEDENNSSTEDENNSSTEDENNSSTEDENSSTEDYTSSTEDENSSTENEDKYIKCECCNNICLECKLLEVD